MSTLLPANDPLIGFVSVKIGTLLREKFGTSKTERQLTSMREAQIERLRTLPRKKLAEKLLDELHLSDFHSDF